jgi:ribosomal protein L32
VPNFVVKLSSPPSLRFPPASRGEPSVARRFGSPCLQGEPKGAGKGTTVRHEVFEAGAIFPSASVNRQVRCIALTPFVPLSRRRERGNALQGAPPCAPTPLSHAVGEGLGVRAKKRARLAHSELKRCTLISFVPLSRRRERGNALQGAPPCAPTPLSHSVGEGLGVRAKKRARLAHSELKRCTLIRPKGGGFQSLCSGRIYKAQRRV